MIFAGTQNREFDQTIIQITNCSFEENFSPNEGGAISLYSSSIYIKNSKFILNKAIFAGSLYLLKTKAYIQAVFFVNNYASQIAGSIIAEDNKFTAVSCRFVSNFASKSSGVGFFSNLDLQFTRCSFLSNQADNAPAFIISKSFSKIIQCDFSANIGLTNSSPIIFELSIFSTFIDQCRFTHISCSDQPLIYSVERYNTPVNTSFASIRGIGSVQFVSCIFSIPQNESVSIDTRFQKSIKLLIHRCKTNLNLEINSEETTDKVFDHSFKMKFNYASSWIFFIIILIGVPNIIIIILFQLMLL